MIAGLWGKKVGMTQLFTEDRVVPVTAIDIAQWIITQIKTIEVDGYNALQVGCLKSKYAKDTFSVEWLKKPRQYFGQLKEIKLTEPAQDLTVGQTIDFGAVIAEGENVDVFGTTIGRGFQGVVKRHRFRGSPGSHGSTMGKRPGSISHMRAQGKVIKGKKLPGHMGVDRCIMQNLEVIKFEKDANTVFIKGSIPGKPGSLVFIRKA